jgi:hypothetical protein
MKGFPMFAQKMFFCAALLAAAMATGLSVQAQQPAPGAPAPAPQMSNTELEKALSQPLLPTHLQIATDVLKASGMMVMFDNAMPNVVGALRVNVTRQRPELARDIEEALKVVEAEIPKAQQDGLSAIARLFAIRMSEPELKEVHTFLVSPAGKKYVDTLPAFMENAVPFLQVWSQEVGGRLTKVFQDEMAKRGHKI